METSCSYVGGERLYVSSDERRWINRINTLADLYPDDVELLALPENNDGCIYASVPAKWLKISPPPKRAPMSEERKQELRENLQKYRESQLKGS